MLQLTLPGSADCEQRYEGSVTVNLLPLHLQKTRKLWTKIRSKDLWVGVLLLLPLESV